MKQVIQYFSVGLVIYVLFEIYSCPLHQTPAPFWDASSESGIVDGKLGIFLIMFGIIALLFCGGFLYTLLKVSFGLVQHMIESVVPSQLKVIAPLIAIMCLLYPVNTYKSEVKHLSISTVMQVNLVLDMSEDYDIRAKQKEKEIDV